MEYRCIGLGMACFSYASWLVEDIYRRIQRCIRLLVRQGVSWYRNSILRFDVDISFEEGARWFIVYRKMIRCSLGGL